MDNQIRIARQPIVDRDNNLYGYELLFRDFNQLPGESADSFISDNQFATSRVVVNALNQFGIQNIDGDHIAFLNSDATFILDDAILNIPADKFFIEILEDVTITDELIERIIFLKEKGYKFALDDATFEDKFLDNFHKALELIDILKIDITLTKPRAVRTGLEKLKQYNFQLLAEKVETKPEFEIYKALGCTLFQGYFFAKPEIKEQTALNPEAKEILSLISILDQDVSQNEIVDAFEKVPQISLQLLRYLNSSSMNLKASITSIKHALGLLGRPPLKNWLLLISFSSGSDTGQVTPLFDLVRTRSVIMGKLAALVNPDKFFTSAASFVGLLSLIDNIFEAPLEDIMNELNLDPDTKLALIAHGGVYGKYLRLVKNLETMDVQTCSELIKELTFTEEEVFDVLMTTYAEMAPSEEKA